MTIQAEIVHKLERITKQLEEGLLTESEAITLLTLLLLDALNLSSQ